MIRMLSARRFAALAFGALLISTGCGKDSSSTATTTAPTPVAAAATITETFSVPLTIGGTAFYSFNFVAYGNLAVTVTRVTGGGLDDGQTLGLGVGRPVGTTCSATTTVSAAPGDAAQLTGVYGPGIYCVRIVDTGSLTAPVTVAVTMSHS